MLRQVDGEHPVKTASAGMPSSKDNEFGRENCIMHAIVSKVKFLHRLQVASKFMPVSSLIIGECNVVK